MLKFDKVFRHPLNISYCLQSSWEKTIWTPQYSIININA